MNLTYLSSLLNWMELAPSDAPRSVRVAKASSGHYPLPFLIRDCKELLQMYRAAKQSTKLFFVLTIVCFAETLCSIVFYRIKKLSFTIGWQNFVQAKT